MEPTAAQKIKPKVHDLSAFKQVMESRSHPLEMVREAISNMMAPEVGASEIAIQFFSHPDYNASFIFKDDGIGMNYTGDDKDPGRLDRFLGLAFSKAAGLKADYWGWKGLGSKLMLNCNKLELESWTGKESEDVFSVTILNPRAKLLSEPPEEPDYFLNRRPPLSSDKKGTKIQILGYDGGDYMYNFEEIKRYLYLNTAIGLTKSIDHSPIVKLKVNSTEETLPIGFQFVTSQYNASGKREWKTVAIDNPIIKTTTINVDGKETEVKVVLKGGFTLDTGNFNLSSRRHNTGLRLSVKGIPYFRLDFHSYKGNKFQQYQDFCSFVIECDALESKLNMDRSAISNQFGSDPIVNTFRKLTAQCFDDFAESEEYIEFLQKRKKEDEKSKAAAVIRRQEQLSDPNQEYVCIETNGIVKPLHKVPEKSEQDTLAIFWKLESLDKLPFEKFITLEHTAREGIDVIATFQVDDESAIQSFVSVEFEYRFENFIQHGHNPKQTGCIICWTVDKPQKLRKVNDYTYYYDIDSLSIPVYEMKNFPSVAVKKYGDIDL